MSTESEKKGIEASFKSMDTEEFLDIYFNRPIGYAWALLFKKIEGTSQCRDHFFYYSRYRRRRDVLLPRYETYPDWYTSIDCGKPL